jgi:hypothetical protein
LLEIGQKGIIDNTEYTVTGIIIRKYGTSIFWREYYLKDTKGKDAFLSESDGHWTFLHTINAMDVKKKTEKQWNCTEEISAGTKLQNAPFMLQQVFLKINWISDWQHTKNM